MSSDAERLAENTRVNSNTVFSDWVPVTPEADPQELGPFRALRAEGGGTITVTTATGQSRVMNFKDGETRLIACTHVTAATATDIEGGK